MIEAISELAEVLNNYGPALTVVAALFGLNGFFIWRDYRREGAQQREIAILQKVHNETVIPLLVECREAIASCREVINQNSHIIARLDR